MEALYENDPVSPKPTVESTVTTVFDGDDAITLVLLLILKLPFTVSGERNNLKYLLLPFKNTVSTFSIAPFAVELVENPAKVP